MENIRSFIAIELPGEVKAMLVRLQERLKAGGSPSTRWVNPNGIHLTLKFLGDTAVSQIQGITSVIESAVREISPFELEIDKLGVFPNPNRVQVVWVGVDGETSRLKHLQENIESGLVPLGFAAEARAFTPHLTLARLNQRAAPVERQRFGQLISGMEFTETRRFTVDSVNFMESQLTREGAIYNRIGTIKLG